MFRKLMITGASVALLALAVTPALAQTNTSNVATKIACVGTAVNIREQSIDAAMTTFTTASNAAYSARAVALGQAYAGTTLKAVSAAVKTAWSTFTSSEKSARSAWQTDRNAAWTAYRTAAVACKAPLGTGDGTHSASDVSGN